MPVVKTIDHGGQLSLGKEHAGKSVMIDEVEPGVWLVKSGSFVPDSERWIHEPETEAKINEAIEWAEKTPPAESELPGERE